MTRGGGGNSIGTAGVLRLWGKDLYGQASWLIVFALFGILVWARKFSFKSLNTKQAAFVYWSIWLAIMCVFFSYASFFHRYYFCMFAPAVAALSAVGFIEMFKAFREKISWRQYILPISFVVTSIISVIYVIAYADLKIWLVPLIIVSCAAALVFMAIYYFEGKRLACILAAGFMLISISAAPFYWSLTAAMYPPQNSTMPYAGPELANPSNYGGSANQETFISSDANTLAIENYLVDHYKTGTYLVVSQSAADVSAYIVDTGLPAVAYGGFLGSDAALPLSRIKELVAQGKITYFLVSTKSLGNAEITNYVKSTAKLINASEYGGVANSGFTLYLFS